MKQRKYYQICIMILSCIFLNFIGKVLASLLQLPVWLDSFGTVVAAYALGPIYGAIVGGIGNIIGGLFLKDNYCYLLIGISIGLLVGLSAKKKVFESLFGTFSTSVVLTIVSVTISTPLNLIFCDGKTGNLWGDGVIGYLTEKKVSQIPSAMIGEFYVDFLDKVITLLALYLLIKFVRRFHIHKPRIETKSHIVAIILIVILTLLSAIPKVSGESMSLQTKSEQTTETNYNTYIQTIYSSNNGLSCGTANDIAQTSDGILWIGTYAGLYRYNGSEFQWMGEHESVRNVNCLYTDEDGRLWIGTNDNGLSILKDEQVVDVIDEEDGLASNSVRCIAAGIDGEYYIGTSDSLQVLTLNAEIEILNTFDRINYATNIAVDEEGHVAVVTSSGELFLLKDREVQCTIGSQENELFNCCSFSKEGLLYVGTSKNHVFIYNLSSGTLVQQYVNACGKLSNINQLYFTDAEQIFVCADNGIGYFDAKGRYAGINTNQFNNSIDTMEIDYQGDLWFTSSRLGLLRLCRSAFTDIYNGLGMDSKVVNSVAEWHNFLYFGTDTGLDIVDLSLSQQVQNKLTEYLKDVRIRCIRTDSRKNLWICTYGKGLLEVDDKLNIRIYDSTDGGFGLRARVVLELADGTIAAAGDSGISLIQDHQIIKTFRYGEGLSNTMILTLLELDDGSILAGTDGDGITVIRDGNIVRKLTRKNGLSSGVILRTVLDPKGDGVFIVTSNGLCYMDSNWKIRRLDNFPYFNNYDIWADKAGNLFVLGSAGIYIVDRDSLLEANGELSYELLNAKDGLTSALTANSWNYCDRNENLYLSCGSGVFRINMHNYANTNKAYRILISSVKLNQTLASMQYDKILSVSRDISRIEITPEIINYTIDDPYVKYYLEGYEKSPTILLQSELTSIIYTNLPPGQYTFHLEVLDHNMSSVLEEKSYLLIKEKAIYDNPWFIAYMLIVLMLAVAWLTWFIVRTQIQRTINYQRKELEFTREQVRMGNETIIAIARTVDAKDERTSQHSYRVSEYSILIARELGFREEECENLRKAALLHDIGKIGISDQVLNKPGRLNQEEYEIMKSHVTLGAEILKDFTLVDHVIDGALYHHEHYDGTGYVHGLKGEEIPLYGRIIGVADAFDAMTSNRVYRSKLDAEYVLHELERCRGTQFDPKIDDIMLKLIREKKIDLEGLCNVEK